MNHRITMVRELTGLNQKDFAKLLNLSASMISCLETGKRSVTDRTISDICRVCGVNEEWLRTGKGEMMSTAISSSEEQSESSYTGVNNSTVGLMLAALESASLTDQEREFLIKFARWPSDVRQKAASLITEAVDIVSSVEDSKEQTISSLSRLLEEEWKKPYHDVDVSEMISQQVSAQFSMQASMAEEALSKRGESQELKTG